MSGSETRLGRTLIIVNPAAHNGAATEAGEQLKRFLELYLHDGSTFHLRFTERAGHASDIAAAASSFDTVLAVGGDGLIHEVACGLMRIESIVRPTMGIIPAGSGNDYARTLNMPEVEREGDLAAILSCTPEALDVGLISYADAAGTRQTSYYVETFSIGLDAAIALGTYGLRQKTGLSGTPLYLASGMGVLGRGYRDFPVMVSFDGAPAERMRTIAFAVQIGPTYGSGFRICPDADPADGLLDICYMAGPVPRRRALPLLLAAKGGRHRRMAGVHSRRATSITFTFPEDGYPIQADGERISARRVSIGILPQVLRVLVRKMK